VLLCIVKQLIHFIPEDRHCSMLDTRGRYFYLVLILSLLMQLSVATGERYKALVPFQLGQKMSIQRENKLTFKIQDKERRLWVEDTESSFGIN